MSTASPAFEGHKPSSTPADVVRRWFEEVWNQGKEEAIDQLLAKDATMWGVRRPDTSSMGSDEFRRFYHEIRSTFSHVQITLDQVIEQGDTAFARWTVEGTHTGANRRLTLKGMSACRVKDGLVVESWNIWDQIGMARQLGALSGQAATLFP